MLCLPVSTLHPGAAKYHKGKEFACLDQFFAMAFAQLIHRESLRDIEVNLRVPVRRPYQDNIGPQVTMPFNHQMRRKP